MTCYICDSKQGVGAVNDIPLCRRCTALPFHLREPEPEEPAPSLSLLPFGAVTPMTVYSGNTSNASYVLSVSSNSSGPSILLKA